MMLFQLAMRNAYRNRRRTLLTAATVLFGVALVTVAVAWIVGIFGGMAETYGNMAGHVRVVDADYAAREELQPIYEHIEDTAPLVEQLSVLPGVEAVEPRIVTGALITADEEIGDDFTLVVGATDHYYTEILGLPDMLARGTWMKGEGEIVIGRKIAEQIGADVGDEVLVLGRTHYDSMTDHVATVTGIVAQDSMLDAQVYLPLETVRYITDIPDGAVEVLVYGSDPSKETSTALARAVRAQPGLEGYTVQAWVERDIWAMMTPVLDGMLGFIRFLILFITSLAIFNTMTMSVMERTSEIGVMRAHGLGRLGAIVMFVLEAGVIGVLGGLGGALLGSAGAWYLEVHGVTLSEDLVDKIETMPMTTTFYADLTPEVVVQAIVLGIAIAIVGALLPALRAASIQPVTAMRSRR